MNTKTTDPLANCLLRPARVDELPLINRVIASAVMNWPKLQRLKRLSVSSYVLDEVDLADFHVVVCERLGHLVGVSAWVETGPGKGLLHSLSVLPVVKGQGIGRLMMESAFKDAQAQGIFIMQIKADKTAIPFFILQGLETATPKKPDDYPYLFYKALSAVA
jgi:N-acetylglutamate synthase-like GNAT family acetyltransferase